MLKPISEIVVRQGWKMRAENGNKGPHLLIEKDVEFDLWTFADNPYFVAPIRIDDEFALYVDTDAFVARGDTVSLEEAIVWTS